MAKKAKSAKTAANKTASTKKTNAKGAKPAAKAKPAKARTPAKGAKATPAKIVKAATTKSAKKAKPRAARPVSIPTLYGIHLSGPTYKVGLMLALTGQKFAYEHINLREGKHKTSDYLEKNRYGQVPCLIDGKMSLCQSASILEYLSEKTGKFSGRSAQEKARIREWMYWDFDRLAPGIYRTRGVKRGFREAAPEVVAVYESDAKAALNVLNEALSKSDFLVGKRATIADIDVYGVIAYAHEGGFDLGEYPHVQAWKTRIEKLKGFGAPEQVLPQESRAA